MKVRYTPVRKSGEGRQRRFTLAKSRHTPLPIILPNSLIKFTGLRKRCRSRRNARQRSLCADVPLSPYQIGTC
jgi:hypothetical protein